MCDAGAHECHVNALCVVSASNRGYDCVCKAGLEGNGNALWSRNDGFFDTIAMGQSLGGNTSCIIVNVNPTNIQWRVGIDIGRVPRRVTRKILK